MRLRWLVPVAFIAIGLVASVCAESSGSIALSIWAGIATSAFAAAFVDIVALIERDRQARPVRSMIARRIGRLHQILIHMISTFFDDVTCDTASDWPTALRALPERTEDLGTPAKVYPARLRRDWVRELLTSLDDVVEELAGLAAAGAFAMEVDILDDALRGSSFISMVRDVAPTANVRLSGRTVLAADAASLLESVQRVMPLAEQAAGTTWTFGEWPRRPAWRVRLKNQLARLSPLHRRRRHPRLTADKRQSTG